MLEKTNLTTPTAMDSSLWAIDESCQNADHWFTKSLDTLSERSLFKIRFSLLLLKLTKFWILNVLGCNTPLGMENGSISDVQISASSKWNNRLGAERARLNGIKVQGKLGAWRSGYNRLGQWLQVDLEKYTTVTGLATQGRSDYSQWVTKYRMQYSDDGVSFQWYKEQTIGSVKVRCKQINK